MLAEYYSVSRRCWMPVVVTGVDPETGAVRIDVKPNQDIDLREQQSKLRPRTRPTQEQIDWARKSIREGELEEITKAIFRRFAQGPARLLLDEDLVTVGDELDRRLGVCGAACMLMHRTTDEDCQQGITEEVLGEIFWEMVWRMLKEFGEVVRNDGGLSSLDLEGMPKHFSMEKTLGQGTYGKVNLARDRRTGARRAVKVIDKQENIFAPGQLEMEIEHLLTLDHPHIVKLYGHYQDREHLYLVMDYCSGGDLQAMVHKTKRDGRRFEESYVADVVRQVLMAIAHVHARGIVHLDLKSANIMLLPSKGTLPPSKVSEGHTMLQVRERPHVMVIDLGVAQIFQPGNFRNNRPTGTPATMAGEVWLGEITPKADIFSCGVVLFELLSLSLPFTCGCDYKLALAYWKSRPAVPWSRLAHATQEAKDLCQTMLQLDRNRRPAATQCLQKSFLMPQDVAEPSQAWASRLMDMILKIGSRSVLYRSVALSIAKVWPSNQLPTIKRLFNVLDRAGTGRLSYESICETLGRFGLEHRESWVIADTMDLNHDGCVDWTEFVAACIDLGTGFEKDLRRIFDEADSDGDKLLSQQDLSSILISSHFDAATAEDMFAELTGRAEQGARLDWSTFHAHFLAKAETLQVGAQPNMTGNVDDGQQKPADLIAQAASQMRGYVGDWMERARDALRAQQAALLGVEVGEPTQELLDKLREMGFTDRTKCVAALKKHGNELGPLVFEDLVQNGGW